MLSPLRRAMSVAIFATLCFAAFSAPSAQAAQSATHTVAGCKADIKAALNLKSYHYYESGCAAIMVPQSGAGYWVPFLGVDRTTKRKSDGKFYLKASCRSGKACIQHRGTPKLGNKIWWQWKVAKTTKVLRMTSCLEYLYKRCK